jgi:Fe/S biogenesis protein NfuA
MMLATDEKRGQTAMDDNKLDDAPVLRVSEKAYTVVTEVLAGEDNAQDLALWLEVSGSTATAYTYDMYFQAAADAAAEDWTHQQDGLRVVVPATSVDRVQGSLLDVSTDGQGEGLVIINPNRPPQMASPAMSAPPADLSGDVAQRVLLVLEEQINPSIAAHGGRADLVAVEDGAAYLRLSGGCAGCGMAAVTLSQGIEVALRESVPEIVRVVDVTDHASGTNPYYEAAKK